MIGFGTVLVLVGLVLIYNFGLTSLFHSPLSGEYRLSDPLTIEVSSHAVVTDDTELLRGAPCPTTSRRPMTSGCKGRGGVRDALHGHRSRRGGCRVPRRRRPR